MQHNHINFGMNYNGLLEMFWNSWATSLEVKNLMNRKKKNSWSNLRRFLLLLLHLMISASRESSGNWNFFFFLSPGMCSFLHFLLSHSALEHFTITPYQSTRAFIISSSCLIRSMKEPHPEEEVLSSGCLHIWGQTRANDYLLFKRSRRTLEWTQRITARIKLRQVLAHFMLLQ